MKSALLLLVSLLSGLAFTQDVIQVNRENKTIAVTADDEASVDAELAILTVGYRNFAVTKDAAFEENVRISNSIVQALLTNHIDPKNIHTENLALSRVDPDEHWSEAIKKERQFSAVQEWKVGIPAARAQALVDLVVRSGANEVSTPDWDVVDPSALQAKAGAAALTKARGIAEKMAQGLGAKLGQLVYASNRAPVSRRWPFGPMDTESAVVEVNGSARSPELSVKVFPQPVKAQATVYAVFAIE